MDRTTWLSCPFEKPLTAATPLHFELDGVEGSLQEMDVVPVASDHQLPAHPLGIFVSADEELEGELFEDVIISGLEIVIRK